MSESLLVENARQLDLRTGRLSLAAGFMGILKLQSFRYERSRAALQHCLL